VPTLRVSAPTGLAEVQPRIGISGGTDCFGQLIGVAAEKIHRLGPVEDEVDDHALGVTGIRLQPQADAAKLIRGKRNLGRAIGFLLQRRDHRRCKLRDRARRQGTRNGAARQGGQACRGPSEGWRVRLKLGQGFFRFGLLKGGRGQRGLWQPGQP
jgi:hypothetical protein